MHGTYAHAPHKRTSLGSPRRAAERSKAAASAMAASPRTLTVEPRPSAAMAATIERPMVVGVGSGEHVDTGLAGYKGH